MTPTQVFSCEICKIFKKTYSEEPLWTTTAAEKMKGIYLILFLS